MLGTDYGFRDSMLSNGWLTALPRFVMVCATKAGSGTQLKPACAPLSLLTFVLEKEKRLVFYEWNRPAIHQIDC
jgi:hypothetical protein